MWLCILRCKQFEGGQYQTSPLKKNPKGTFYNFIDVTLVQMIVKWDNVDWLMRGWSFVPHLCTILKGQSDIIDGCCLKVKVVAEVNWFDFGSIECEWSFCPFSMLYMKIGLEVIFKCASFSRGHYSVSQWAIDIFSIAVRTSHKKYQNFARILSFWSNL